MSEKTRIEERLRKKELEIKGLEEKIKEARVYMQALRDILKMMDKAEEAQNSPESTLKPGSMVAQARDAIIQHGRPIHIDELLEFIGIDVTRESKASLAGSLAAYVRRQEIFTRPAPSTFGLVELGHTTDESDDLPEPPEGFGRDPTNDSRE